MITTMALTVTSLNFTNGEAIPNTNLLTNPSMRGKSPVIKWSASNSITNAVEYIVLVHDTFSAANNWVHWIVYDIPLSLTNIPSGLATTGTVTLRSHPVSQGTNSYGLTGYGGPYVSAPTGLHQYHFTVYAVSSPYAHPTVSSASYNNGTYYTVITNAIQSAGVVAKGTLIGIYDAP